MAQLHDKPMTIRRPDWFFREDGDMPEEVTLRFVRPPGFEHLTHAQWAEQIRSALARREAKAAREREETGKRIVGRRAILRQSPFDTPRRGEPRRGLRPRVACKNKWRRIETLRRNVEFQRRYRQALEAMMAGEDVVFPGGSYQLRELGIVRVEPPPPA
jgi:putative transposase